MDARHHGAQAVAAGGRQVLDELQFREQAFDVEGADLVRRSVLEDG